MKVVLFECQNRSSYCVMLARVVEDLEFMSSQLEQSPQQVLQKTKIEPLDLSNMLDMASDEIRYLSILANQTSKTLFIGINGATHIAETDHDMPAYPMIVTCFAGTHVAHEHT